MSELDMLWQHYTMLQYPRLAAAGIFGLLFEQKKNYIKPKGHEGPLTTHRTCTVFLSQCPVLKEYIYCLSTRTNDVRCVELRNFLRPVWQGPVSKTVNYFRHQTKHRTVQCIVKVVNPDNTDIPSVTMRVTVSCPAAVKILFQHRALR